MKVLYLMLCIIIRLSSCKFIEDINQEDRFPATITFLTSDIPKHVKLNSNFQRLAVKMGFRVHEIFLEENSIAATEAINAIFPNVINLLVQGKSNVEERLKEKQALYNSDHLRCLKRYHSEIIPDCDFANESIIYSDHVLKYRSLLKLLETDGNLYERPKILVCLPKLFNTDNFQTELTHANRDKILNFNKCDQNTVVNEDHIAVISDKPIQDTKVPTIFYQMPYKYSWLDDRFPNSVIVSAPWNSLQYALINFLKYMKWYRVAVVSDDSEYSEVFLAELIPLFLKEGIVFNSQDCERQCDFNKALDTLYKAKARIVIINVDPGKYGDLLRNAIDRFRKTPMKWIVRDWPFHNRVPVANIYSLTLHPIYGRDGSQTFPYSSAIKEGLNIISDVYRTVLQDKETFKRDFTKLAKRRRFNIAARLSYHQIGKAAINVADFVIVGSQTKTPKYNLQEAISSDLPQNCLARSNDFFESCANDVILLLITIGTMFAFIMLIIVLFFNAVKAHPGWYRMH